MRRTSIGFGAAAVATLALAWTASGLAQQDPDTAGNKVSRGVDKLKQGAERIGEGVREGFDRARNNVHKMGVESRIYGRLHWDKDLTDADIVLEMRDPDIAVLKGSVPTEAAKIKADLLAKDTVGVGSVVNELTVGPATTTTTTKTTKTTTTKTKN